MNNHLKYPELFSHVITFDGGVVGRGGTSGTSLIDTCLARHPGIESKLKIMIMERVKPENQSQANFAKYLDSKGIKNIYLTADLTHDATLFYKKYLTEIMEFEKNNLCK